MPGFSILPSKPQFFDLYERATANLVDAARALNELMQNYSAVDRRVAEIVSLEQKGDMIVHEITDLIHTSLIAPLDHEDTQALISAIDNTLDAIESAAVRMQIFKIEQPTEMAHKLADVIYQSTQHLHAAIQLLRQRGNVDKIKAHIVHINDLENEGDKLFRRGLEELVEQHEDMFNFLRWQEIYERLEATTDRVEDAGDVLQAVLIKNA